MKTKNVFLQVLTWLAFIALCSILALGIWAVCFGESSQDTIALKWMQFLQSAGIFLIPPIICACIWKGRQSLQWLGVAKSCSWREMGIAVLLMISALPLINVLAYWNNMIKLPESLHFIEVYFREYEEIAALLTERFLQADNIVVLFINLGLMALLPALAEELSFRGVLQQLISGDSNKKIHVAIWVSAFIFSAIHMQFYGFIPRMLMGALFGYAFVWTGTLWVPIVMHFVNNSIAVISYYILSRNTQVDMEVMETLGTGSTWWLGLLSLLLVILFIRLLYKNYKSSRTL